MARKKSSLIHLLKDVLDILIQSVLESLIETQMYFITKFSSQKVVQAFFPLLSHVCACSYTKESNMPNQPVIHSRTYVLCESNIIILLCFVAEFFL